MKFALKVVLGVLLALATVIVLLAGCTAILTYGSLPDTRSAPRAASSASTTSASGKASPSVSVPAEGDNALRTAQRYIDSGDFSRTGLVKQLKFEGFPKSATEYAADNVAVDWNAEAVGAAESYQNSLGLSKKELKTQLKFEGFTDAQVKYALERM